MYQPYAPPGLPAVAGTRLTVSKQGLWPPICVKCGSPDVRPRTQRFRWFPPWTYALLLVGLVPAAIVQMILTKEATLVLPVCPPCNARWTMARVVYALAVIGPLLLGLLLMTVGAMNDSAPLLVVGLLLLPGMILFAVLATFLLVRPRTVRAVFIDDWVITVDGVAPHVLAAFQPR